jgi:betaine-aldehyde dehydrogenase
MAIVQDEIFGPVLCVQSFATEDEAIAERCSRVPGLSGSIVSDGAVSLTGHSTVRVIPAV